ncbi:MAG TPA: hypothetical protein VNF46_02700 [Gammaproteobacteria bacterium]|nr:hypothetical protein [Gammaproteobacteria bacterium]
MEYRSKQIRLLTLPLLVCLLGLYFLKPAHADTLPPDASPATARASPSASPTKAPQSANLGKINVTAEKELIKTLQVVKVALHEPYSDSRAQADVVVCRIIQGHGHLDVEERMGAVLECGTNSWFTWQRERCQNSPDLAACAADVSSAAYKRKGAWHSMRALNLKQLGALRQLLNTLPPPGKGQVVVVDKTGKTIIKN